MQTRRMFYYPDCHYNSVEGLLDLCKEIIKPDFVIVEVGSYAGVSSDLFARFCKKLYCVDIWEGDYEGMREAERMFDEVLEAHKNIMAIQNYSLIAALDFSDGELDMVYIDGGHGYENVKEDIQAWMPKIKKGGWLTGHDIHLDTVRAAVEEITTEYKRYNDESWAWQIK